MRRSEGWWLVVLLLLAVQIDKGQPQSMQYRFQEGEGNEPATAAATAATKTQRAANPEQCTLFVHLPKTGGSSLEEVVRKLLDYPVEFDWRWPVPELPLDSLKSAGGPRVARFLLSRMHQGEVEEEEPENTRKEEPWQPTAFKSAKERIKQRQNQAPGPERAEAKKGQKMSKAETAKSAPPLAPATFFFGHFTISGLPILENLGLIHSVEECFTFVIMREPVARAISAYYFMHMDKHTNWNTCLQNPLACQSAECLVGCLMLHNDATRKLSGSDAADTFNPTVSLAKLPYNRVTTRHLQAAKHNLEQMDAVLITEHMEQSVRLLECKMGAALGRPFPQAAPVVHVNKGPAVPQSDSRGLPYQQIAQANRLDAILYQHSLVLFAAQLRSCHIPIPASLNKTLADQTRFSSLQLSRGTP